MSDIKGPRVLRQAPSATWEYEHRWGTLLSDTTTLRVTRVRDGRLTISYGKDSIDIRETLVPKVAAMVAAAAAWRDEQEATTPTADAAEEGDNSPAGVEGPRPLPERGGQHGAVS